MGLLPLSRYRFVGFCPTWIGMNRLQDGSQAEAMFHGQRKLGEHVAGPSANDNDPENTIFAGDGQDFDEAGIRVIGDSAIELGEVESDHVVRDALLLRVLLRQADPRHFRIGINHARKHPEIGVPSLQTAKQRIHGGEPRIVARSVGELKLA